MRSELPYLRIPFIAMSITPQALQALRDEVEASRASRKRAWENLQELRWVLKDAAGIELPPPARKTIDLEGRLVKDGVRKALTQRREALEGLSEPCASIGRWQTSSLSLFRVQIMLMPLMNSTWRLIVRRGSFSHDGEAG
jgi:hypothetical protein